MHKAAAAGSTSASVARATVQHAHQVWQLAKSSTPTSLKQLAAAARAGRLLRVSDLQLSNAWLACGTCVVAVGGACAAYAAWRGVESVASAWTTLQQHHYALTATVRTGGWHR